MDVIARQRIELGRKRCKRCKQFKAFSEFRPTKSKYRYWICKVCEVEIRKEWIGQNRARYLELRHKEYLKRKAKGIARKRELQVRYQLTPEQYAQLLEQQGGICAICTRPAGIVGRGDYLHVDHTVDAGGMVIVRGLLCTNCNMGLGFFADDPQRLKTAIEYLSNPRHFAQLNHYGQSARIAP